jgi:hypothetical protein
VSVHREVEREVSKSDRIQFTAPSRELDHALEEDLRVAERTVVRAITIRIGQVLVHTAGSSRGMGEAFALGISFREFTPRVRAALKWGT